MPSRRLLWPLLSTILLVGLTSGLGVWQLQRLAWKRGLLGQIERAERLPAVTLGAHPGRFEKLRVEGRLDGTHALSYADDVRDDAQGNPVMGTFLVEPLLRPGAPPLLVDLGWVPYPPRPLSGAVRLIGYARPAEHAGWLSARDDPAGRRFYTLDPERIAAGLGLGSVAPFTLVALGPAGSPDPARALPRPPNDHLQYAITWFSLALAGVVMFLVWLRGARPPKRLD